MAALAAGEDAGALIKRYLAAGETKDRPAKAPQRAIGVLRQLRRVVEAAMEQGSSLASQATQEDREAVEQLHRLLERRLVRRRPKIKRPESKV